MSKPHHSSYEETKKIYGKTIALRIDNDSLTFIERTVLKENIEQEKPRDFRFRIDIYEKEEKEKSINVIRKLFFKNKLIGTSQKKYKLI